MTLTLRTAPGAAERAAFIGLTRSGKTTLMRELAGSFASVVVFDSKQNPHDWNDWAAARGWAVAREPSAVRRYARVVLLVDTRWTQDRGGWVKPGSVGFNWTEALGSVFYRVSEGASTLVIFDEGMHTLNLNPHPDARRLFTQGAGIGLPAWLGTQAPNWIDTVALAQAEHCFGFKNTNLEHLKALRERRGIPAEVLKTLHGPDEPGGHDYAHHHIGADHWDVFPPLKLVTRLRTPNTTPEPAQRNKVTKQEVRAAG